MTIVLRYITINNNSYTVNTTSKERSINLHIDNNDYSFDCEVADEYKKDIKTFINRCITVVIDSMTHNEYKNFIPNKSCCRLFLFHDNEEYYLKSGIFNIDDFSEKYKTRYKSLYFDKYLVEFNDVANGVAYTFSVDIGNDRIIENISSINLK